MAIAFLMSPGRNWPILFFETIGLVYTFSAILSMPMEFFTKKIIFLYTVMYTIRTLFFLYLLSRGVRLAIDSVVFTVVTTLCTIHYSIKRGV